jgi:hypothetical protein
MAEPLQYAPLPPRIWLDGRPLASNDPVLQVQVEERSDDASSFRLVLDLSPIEGDWDLLEHGSFAAAVGLPEVRLMTRVTIELALAADSGPEIAARVMDGYVTALEPVFGENRASDSQLIADGLDASCLMHFETLTRDWHGVTDADIARELFAKYGFAVDGDRIDATGTPRDFGRGAFMQRCTDAELLRQLARRNGFECYVEALPGAVAEGAHPRLQVGGHFRAPRPFDEAGLQPPLALFPAGAPSLIEFRARWDSHQPTRVRGWHLDDRSRRVQRSEITAAGYQAGGEAGGMGTHPRARILEERLGAILGGSPPVTAADIQSPWVPHDQAELGALARADFRAADWFVRGSGTVRGERYGQILRPRRPVELSGAGHLLDGRWYVRTVRHRWGLYPDAEAGGDGVEEQDNPRYEADVDMVRNALGGAG